METNCKHEWSEYVGKEGLIAECKKCRARREVTDEKSLTEHLIVLFSVREEYREKAGGSTSESARKGFEKAVADKDEQIAAALNRLPYKLYSTEELLGFVGLESLPELWLPEIASGGDWLSGGLFPTRVAWMGVRIARWAVWEPKELPIDLLQPHPLNTLIYSVSDISALAGQIKDSGWIKPIVIDRRRRVVSGNRRLAAGKVLALASLSVEEIISEDETGTIRRLILENASRIKTVEQRVREARILEDIPGWLGEVRESRQRTIVEKAIEYLEARGETDRAGQLVSLATPDAWKLLKSWNLEDLKIERAIRGRDLIAESVGLGSGENLRKAAKVVEAIDFFGSIGRRAESESLRKELDKSVDGAKRALREIEKAEKESIFYRYVGPEIRGVAHLLQPGDTCYPAAIELNDRDKQAVKHDYADEVFFVLWRDLKIIGLEDKKRKKPEKSTTIAAADAVESVLSKPETPSEGGIRKVPFEVGREVVRRDVPDRLFTVRAIDGPLLRVEATGEDYRESSHWENYTRPPTLAIGARVRFVLREKTTGEVTRIQWAEKQDCWLYHVLRDDGKNDSAFEGTLEELLDREYAVGDWVSDGGSIGVVESIDPFVVAWMGIGDVPAPKCETVEFGSEAPPEAARSLLRPAAFDPLCPPKRVIGSFKIDDRVSPDWDRERTKRGRIVSRDGDYVDIAWDNGETSQLRPEQLALVEYEGFSLGDRARVNGGPIAPEIGQIVALYRRVSDVKLEDGRKCRVPYSWIQALPPPLLALQSVHEAVSEYLTEQQYPEGAATTVVRFAPLDAPAALKHIKAVVKILDTPMNEELKTSIVAAFQAYLDGDKTPAPEVSLADMATEEELLHAVRSLSPAGLERAIVALWKRYKEVEF